VVRRGDTLASIAARFGTTVDVLVRLNRIANPNRIYVGQLLALPMPGKPGTAIRINFPPGGTSASLTGTVTFPNRVCYVLRALAGQEMTVEVMSSRTAANFMLTSLANGQPLKRLENESRRWTGTLPANGDYQICIAIAAGSIPYGLYVSVSPRSGSTPAERIQFPAGGTWAERSGTVSGVGSRCYVLRAMVGQLMTVQVGSYTGLASFSLVGPDGQPLKRAEVGDPWFSVWLPMTGDYTICVRIPSGTGATDYSMTVSVTS
jgi:LysM repeat protein